jgi:two-component system, chemotaxis family, chemotaxis protein CheY
MVETESRRSAGILLVEDDRDVRDAIAEVLEEEGFQVARARTGVDALEQLGKSHQLPAAIVLDLMMPLMDGWEFWSLQQSHYEWASIPVVVISADTNAKDKSSALRPIACLRKPLDIDELLAILTRLTDASGGPAPTSTSTGASAGSSKGAA